MTNTICHQMTGHPFLCIITKPQTRYQSQIHIMVDNILTDRFWFSSRALVRPDVLGAHVELKWWWLVETSIGLKHPQKSTRLPCLSLFLGKCDDTWWVFCLLVFFFFKFDSGGPWVHSGKSNPVVLFRKCLFTRVKDFGKAISRWKLKWNGFCPRQRFNSEFLIISHRLKLYYV